MGNPRRTTIDIVTATGGGATQLTGGNALTGRLVSLIYEKDPTTPLASTADLTITNERDGSAILAVSNINATTRYAPRIPTHTATGAAISGGVDAIVLVDDRIKVVVAQGGNTKRGKLHVITD